MNSDDFRQYGKQSIDWIADYLDQPERYPVLSRVKPGEVKGQLPAQPPESPESFDDIMRDFDEVIMPGITHWNNPAFIAYFGATGSMPGILGELLTAGLNVNGMLWRTSPSVTELEEVVLDWLRQMVGLPDTFKGVIMDTASISSMIAVAAAREALESAHPRRRDGGPIGFAALDDVHVRAIALVDREGRHRAGDRTAECAQDRSRCGISHEARLLSGRDRGRSPIGIRAVLCVRHRRHDIDHQHRSGVRHRRHLPARESLVARRWCVRRQRGVVPEMRHVLQGVERADSFVMNPHKWMFTPIDFSAFYTRHVDIAQARLQHSAGISAHGRGQHGDELHGLRRAVGTAFPRVEILVHGADIRCGRLSATGFASTSVWRSCSRVGCSAAPEWEVVAPVPFSTSQLPRLSEECAGRAME